MYGGDGSYQGDPSGVYICVKITDQAIVDDAKINGFGQQLDEIGAEVKQCLKNEGIKYNGIYYDLNGWIPS